MIKYYINHHQHLMLRVDTRTDPHTVLYRRFDGTHGIVDLPFDCGDKGYGNDSQYIEITKVRANEICQHTWHQNFTETR